MQPWNAVEALYGISLQSGVCKSITLSSYYQTRNNGNDDAYNESVTHPLCMMEGLRVWGAPQGTGGVASLFYMLDAVFWAN